MKHGMLFLLIAMGLTAMTACQTAGENRKPSSDDNVQVSVLPIGTSFQLTSDVLFGVNAMDILMSSANYVGVNNQSQKTVCTISNDTSDYNQYNMRVRMKSGNKYEISEVGVAPTYGDSTSTQVPTLQRTDISYKLKNLGSSDESSSISLRCYICPASFSANDMNLYSCQPGTPGAIQKFLADKNWPVTLGTGSNVRLVPRQTGIVDINYQENQQPQNPTTIGI